MSKESQELVDSKRSWFTLSVAFLSLFGAGGLQMSFGTILAALVKEFGESKSKTAWIGSVVTFFACVLSPLTIFLSQRHGIRATHFIGGAFLTLGVITTSLVHSINYMFLTYGVLVGIGSALIKSPALSAIPEFFEKYVSIATAIGTSGSTLGLIFFSFILPSLLENVGWRSTLWVVAGIGPLISLCGFAFPKVSIKPDSSVKTVSEKDFQEEGEKRQHLWKSLKKKAFVLWCVGFSTFCLIELVPLYLVPLCATESGIPESQTKWFNIIFGLSCFFGKLISGSLAQPLLRRDQCKYLYLAAMFTYSLSSFLVSINIDFKWLASYMAVVGLLEGMLVSMFFIVTLEIVGVEHYPGACGVVLSLCAISLTAGPPLAGILYETLPHVRYLLLAISATSFLAAVVMAIIPCVTPRRLYTLHQGTYDYWRVYCHNPNVSPRALRQARAFTVLDMKRDLQSSQEEPGAPEFGSNYLPAAISQQQLVAVDELQNA